MRWHRLAAVALFLAASASSFLGGCQKYRGPEAEYPTVVIISDIALEEPDCSDCGARLSAAYEETAGVIGALFHPDSQEITVSYDPAKTNPTALLAIAKSMGIHASEGVGAGVSDPEVEFPPDMDVRVISEAGEMVELSDHIVSGTITVFDFRAVWCGPCREVDVMLNDLARDGADFAVRILDVSDWDSPVANHYLDGLDGLPYLIIVGADGVQETKIVGLDPKALRLAILGEPDGD